MRRYTLDISGKEYVIDVQELAADRFQVMVGNEKFEVCMSSDEDVAQATITPEIAPVKPVSGSSPASAATLTAYHPPAPETLRPLPYSRQPALPPHPDLSEAGFRPDLRSPMPGTILSVSVSAGDQVSLGQTLLILEAMKMKNAIKSPQAARVAEVSVQAGQTVGYGDMLVRFEPLEGEA